MADLSVLESPICDVADMATVLQFLMEKADGGRGGGVRPFSEDRLCWRA
jgi:hypothetical protein